MLSTRAAAGLWTTSCGTRNPRARNMRLNTLLPTVVCAALLVPALALAPAADDATTQKVIKKESIQGGGEPFPAATPRAIVSVTEKVFPAVVRLDVAQEIYTEGKRNLRRGIGSGVIIDDD